jgi:hypothetical protein
MATVATNVDLEKDQDENDSQSYCSSTAVGTDWYDDSCCTDCCSGSSNKHRIEAIVFTVPLGYRSNSNDRRGRRGQHQQGRSRNDEDDQYQVPMLQRRQRLLSYEDETELIQKMNDMYFTTSEDDAIQQDSPQQPHRGYGEQDDLQRNENDEDEREDDDIVPDFIKRGQFKRSHTSRRRNDKFAIQPIPFPVGVAAMTASTKTPRMATVDLKRNDDVDETTATTAFSCQTQTSFHRATNHRRSLPSFFRNARRSITAKLYDQKVVGKDDSGTVATVTTTSDLSI